jgi:glucose-6-phosphate isomerase
MQLPDEAITYQYQHSLVPAAEDWTPAAELRAEHLLSPQTLKDIQPRMLQVRSQVATEREWQGVLPDPQPMDAGFIDLPQKTLDQYRRKGDASTLGQLLKKAAYLREQCDRVVVLGIGGSYLGARALFEALRSAYHNELSPESRLGTPRIHFEGNNVDNDALQELLELIQQTCVDPEIARERWGVIVISKSGETIETTVAYRTFRRELAEYYGSNSPRCRELVVPITGKDSKLRELCLAEGFSEEDTLTIPDDIGGRYSVFTPAGLFPAAVMGLDVRALLLGAATMTRRFLDEPFERNPVLQYAAVNYLMSTTQRKPIRVLSIWSKKLEALGPWYDHLLSESLGKQGLGSTPITTVQTRDLHSRGQLHQEGPRDKFINNLVVRTPRQPPIMIGMMNRNEDDLNQLNRRGLPDVMDAALRGVTRAYFEAARPTADIVVPTLSEHTLGQLMQMLMLATVVEGRLMGVSPYGEPGVEAYKRHMRESLGMVGN